MTGIVRFKVWRSSLYDLPERCEFVRETAHYFIRHNGTRDQKKSRFYAYYATQQEAQAAIDSRNRERKELADKRRVESYGPELLAMLERAISWMEEADTACFDYEAGPNDTYSEAAVITQAKELAATVKGEQPCP